MEKQNFALNIILIDDNKDHAKILQWALRKTGRQDSYTCFGDGTAALEYLKNLVAEKGQTPDLIFLDLNLPRLDGREVLRRLKEEDSTSVIPVIVVSSSEREEDVRRAYELGATDYVSKSAILDDVTPMLKTLEDASRQSHHATNTEM